MRPGTKLRPAQRSFRPLFGGTGLRAETKMERTNGHSRTSGAPLRQYSLWIRCPFSTPLQLPQFIRKAFKHVWPYDCFQEIDTGECDANSVIDLVTIQVCVYTPLFVRFLKN